MFSFNVCNLSEHGGTQSISILKQTLMKQNDVGGNMNILVLVVQEDIDHNKTAKTANKKHYDADAFERIHPTALYSTSDYKSQYASPLVS